MPTLEAAFVPLDLTGMVGLLIAGLAAEPRSAEPHAARRSRPPRRTGDVPVKPGDSAA